MQAQHQTAIVISKNMMMVVVVVVVVLQAGREVVAMAREMLGGNGILSDFLVAKQFCDMEVTPPWADRPNETLLLCSVQSAHFHVPVVHSVHTIRRFTSVHRLSFAEI